MINQFSTPAMSRLFSPDAHVQGILLFEAALARAEAHSGVIPAEAAQEIVTCCRVELFDVVALYDQAILAGTLAIPLVRQLTALVAPLAQKYVHWGATSQDAIDTALMLQMRDGLDLLITEANEVCALCASLADAHRHTLMAGRTLLQQGLPIPFGLKAARWLLLLVRQVQALSQQRRTALALQFGGAVGTLAALGEQGLSVAELLASDLNLPLFDLPWHAERDRVVQIATTLGVLSGSLEKIAVDLVLLAQTEVGEALTRPVSGKGGSSAMPHKHNPVDAVRARASAHLAMGAVTTILSGMAQEHERAAGAWQAEWRAIPDLFCATACAVDSVRQALTDLQIDPERMKDNLELTAGLLMAESLTMALAVHIGRAEAYHQVEMLCRRVVASKTTLLQVALEDELVSAHLQCEEIERALDPASYLGSSEHLIDRALTMYRTAALR